METDLGHATEKRTIKRGFPGLRCILCGRDEAILSLDLDDCNAVRCNECEEQFSLDEVREHVAAWGRVLDWVDAAPLAE